MDCNEIITLTGIVEIFSGNSLILLIDVTAPPFNRHSRKIEVTRSVLRENAVVDYFFSPSNIIIARGPTADTTSLIYVHMLQGCKRYIINAKNP